MTKVRSLALGVAQKVLDAAVRHLARHHPNGYWIGVSKTVPPGTMQYAPAAGPLSGAPLRLRIDQVIFPSVMATGHWEAQNARFFLEKIPPGSTLVDIGANIGLFTRQALHLCPSLIGSVCFEPNAENFDALQFNLGQTDKPVKLVNAGISKRAGAAPLFQDPTNTGNYSLIPDVTGSSVPSSANFISADEAANISVQFAKNGPIAYKSDTQGFDEQIATSLPDWFWGCVAVAQIELWQVNNKPTLDRDRFAKIISQFPNRMYLGVPPRQLQLDEILEWASGTSGASKDLLLWKD